MSDAQSLAPGRLGFADERDLTLFVETLEKFERGEITPDDWRAFRLLNGVYGQRQDDVYMVRVKIPQGIATAPQLLALAEFAERWGNGKGHITTRQCIQYHFVKLADSEAGLRLLAEAGLTTKEACGNSVRNITGCPYAGVSDVELFDTTPYAEALTRHLLRGRFSSSLPRKFKIAMGGCCGTDDIHAAINDLGFLARLDAQGRPGFRVTAAGGLSTLRRSGLVLHEFLPAEELLEAGEAVVRVFDRIGDRKNRAKARLKWAVQKLGEATFLAEYQAERERIRAEGGRPLVLPAQPPVRSEAPKAPDSPAVAHPDFPRWQRENVRPQKQAGFSAVTLRITLGDLRPAQFRALADLATRFGEGELRFTDEQNLVLRFVPTWQLPELHRACVAADLALIGPNTVADVTSCPGATSCKLAVTSSKGVADTIVQHLEARPELTALARELNIKVSGCPNGCGQHYIAGISLQGAMRKVGGRPVPQYFVSIGGSMGPNGAVFARLVAKVPARRVPTAVERLIRLYAAEKQAGETPQAFFGRLPVPSAEAVLRDLTVIDEATATPEDFIDVGETQAFEVVLQEGECAA